MSADSDIYVCLHCDFAACRSHALWHTGKTDGEHSLYLVVHRPEMAPAATEPGVRDFGGVVRVPSFEPVEATEALDVAHRVWDAHDAALVFEMAALRANKCPCIHMKELQQQPGHSVRQCQRCSRTSNLWLCLHCGHVGCGRSQVGADGGGHALSHAELTGHAVAVKLDSLNGLDPVLSADVFCYLCDRDVEDPELVRHLATFGIDYHRQRPSQKSLAQQELQQFMARYYGSEAASRAVSVAGPGLRGLRNTGNICYMLSVMQSLACCRPFRTHLAGDEGLQRAAEALPRGSAAYSEPGLQLRRLLNGLMHGTSEWRDPGQTTSTVRLLQPLVVASLTSGASRGRQQDASEFLQLLAEERRQDFAPMALTLVGEQHCARCGGVCYGATREMHMLRASVYGAKEAMGDLEPLPLNSVLEAGLHEQIGGFTCPHCQRKTLAEVDMLVDRWPDVLTIHVDRTGLGPTGLPVKLETAVDIGTELDLSSFTARCTKGEVFETLLEMEFPQELAQRASALGRSLEEALDYIDREQGEGAAQGTARYRLRSLVTHVGSSAQHGHYISYQLVDESIAPHLIAQPGKEYRLRELLATEATVWVEINDEVVQAGIDPPASNSTLLFLEKIK